MSRERSINSSVVETALRQQAADIQRELNDIGKRIRESNDPSELDILAGAARPLQQELAAKRQQLLGIERVRP